jgi:dCTP deaminase
MIVNRSALLQAAPIKDMATQKQRSHGVSWGLAEAGYDIRINQEISFKPNSIAGCHIIVDNGEPEWGRFCIASAMEEFDMPADLVGIVHDKSTWARQGLSVFNTVIEPGFKGGLTLELVFHGNKELTIPAGAGIAQVIFNSLAHDACYEGKYQNQSTEPTPSIFG